MDIFPSENNEEEYPWKDLWDDMSKDPNSSKLLNNMVGALINLNRFNEALEVIDVLLKSAKIDDEAYVELSLVKKSNVLWESPVSSKVFMIRPMAASTWATKSP